MVDYKRGALKGEVPWTDCSVHHLANILVDIVVESQPAVKHLLIEQVSVGDYIGNISRQEGMVIQLVEDIFGYF